MAATTPSLKTFEMDAGARALAADVALPWLINLRWHAVGGQIITIAIAHFVLKIPLQHPSLLGAIVGVTVLTNLSLKVFTTRPRDNLLFTILLGDSLLFTALLALAGGPDNPFAMFYMAQIAVGAFVLSTRATIRFTGLVLVMYGALFHFYPQGPHRKHDEHDFTLWLAVTLSAVVIASVVRRLATAVRARQNALFDAQRKSARAETIASLGTLAAGAAHELSTPLGTIAVAANELDTLIHTHPDLAAEDACLIRDEVDRCRAIIHRMAARAGEQIGELPVTTTLGDIRERVLASISSADRPWVDWLITDDHHHHVMLPVLGTAQALTALIHNALAAKARTGIMIESGLDTANNTVRFVVVDRGPGIPIAIRDRLGAPFLTTKSPGEGVGLGIFLCQAFADAWGGQLDFIHRDEAESGIDGTSAILRLPRTCAS
jgi:two-component system, sensor histidine kinase RegB